MLRTQCDGCEIVAVCDISAGKLTEAARDTGLSPDRLYGDSDEFFSRGKLADALVIATMDRCHFKQAIRAIGLGYDILLEKPISNDENECREIIRCAAAHKTRITVCHVLRYAPFFIKIKELLSSGTLGEVVSISQTENVGYWHQAHSFVRGNWRNSRASSPMILQKCCHDLDIVRWMVDRPCLSVSSFGSLKYFTAENAPESSAERCIDCKIENCIYNAVDFYTQNEAGSV